MDLVILELMSATGQKFVQYKPHPALVDINGQRKSKMSVMQNVKNEILHIYC